MVFNGVGMVGIIMGSETIYYNDLFYLKWSLTPFSASLRHRRDRYEK